MEVCNTDQENLTAKTVLRGNPVGSIAPSVARPWDFHAIAPLKGRSMGKWKLS